MILCRFLVCRMSSVVEDAEDLVALDCTAAVVGGSSRTAGLMLVR